MEQQTTQLNQRRSASELYNEAYQLTEEAKMLTNGSLKDKESAINKFQIAIKNLNRLSIIESASQRQLLKETINELQHCITMISTSVIYYVEKAMELHANAKELEAQGQNSMEEIINQYITAGEWYYKAYQSYTNAKDSIHKQQVETQIEYLIQHVNTLKLKDKDPPDSIQYQLPRAPLMKTRQSLSRKKSAILVSSEGLAASLVEHTASLKQAYPPHELDVLRRTSVINKLTFVPWLLGTDDDPISTSREFLHLDKPFEDPDGLLPLSNMQVRRGAKWIRPSEYAIICGNEPKMIHQITPTSVKQDIVTDCSFVASLCIAAEYEIRFKKQLISNIIFPIDPETRMPIYNPSGKYAVKLWANGVPRKVVIDDRLPMNSHTGQLLVSTTTYPNELWISLIEKAYLKLHGGYDFPGGNSGIDLFALTGWIPEHVPVSEFLLKRDKEETLWKQMKSAFDYGDCIITMTTDTDSNDIDSFGDSTAPGLRQLTSSFLDLDRQRQLNRKKLHTSLKDVGLVPCHVYAILNVYELQTPSQETVRLLLVKNPWRKLSWTGPFSKRDASVWDGPMGDELRRYEQQFQGDQDESTEESGLFWMNWESVKTYCESLHLNWNPSLFPFKYNCHEHWPVEIGPANDSITLGYNPQFTLKFDRNDGIHRTSSKKSTVWILLSRHVRKTERNDQEDSSTQQYLTLHVYRFPEGKRVFYNQENLVSWGTYSNNPHTLVSLDVDFNETPSEDNESDPSYTLVLSQYEKFAPLDYTLSIFSTTKFNCSSIPQIPTVPSTHNLYLQNEWDTHSAGGRPFFSTYMDNPQYHLQIPFVPHSRVYIFLEAGYGQTYLESANIETTSFPMNLRLVLHKSERITDLPSSTSQSKVYSSGVYRYGVCYIELDASGLNKSGTTDAIVIPSTFEPQSLEKFTLRIVRVNKQGHILNENVPVITATHLPREGYGYNAIVFKDQWTGNAAAGSVGYSCYTFNPKYLVHVETECQVFARLLLRFNDPSSRTREDNDTILSSNSFLFASNNSVATTDANANVGLNLSIYESDAQGHLLLSTSPSQAIITTHEPELQDSSTSSNSWYYSGKNQACGVLTKQKWLKPGYYVIIPSTYDPLEQKYELRVYSTQQLNIQQVE